MPKHLRCIWLHTVGKQIFVEEIPAYGGRSRTYKRKTYKGALRLANRLATRLKEAKINFELKDRIKGT